MIKRKVQRESVFQMPKRSQQKNVVCSLMILHQINPQSNLRQSRRNKLSSTSKRNLNLNLMSIWRNKEKRNNLSKRIQSVLSNLRRSKSKSLEMKKLLMMTNKVLMIILNTIGSKIH